MILVVSMLARKLSPRWPDGLHAFLLVSLLLGGSITAAASPTLLTNGHPIFVDLPPGEVTDGFLDRFIVNGDDGYIIQCESQ